MSIINRWIIRKDSDFFYNQFLNDWLCNLKWSDGKYSVWNEKLATFTNECWALVTSLNCPELYYFNLMMGFLWKTNIVDTVTILEHMWIICEDLAIFGQDKPTTINLFILNLVQAEQAAVRSHFPWKLSLLDVL